MIDCPACTEAATEVSHYFMAGCKGCTARAFSRMPAFFAARQSSFLDVDFRSALRQAGVTHEEVKAAVAADRLQSGAEEP